MDVMCWCFGDVTIIISLFAKGMSLNVIVIHTFQSPSYSEDVSRVQGPYGSIWPYWGRRAIKVPCRHDVSSLWSLPSIWGFLQWHEVGGVENPDLPTKRGPCHGTASQEITGIPDRWDAYSNLQLTKKPESDPQQICSFSRHFEGPTIQAITIIWF